MSSQFLCQPCSKIVNVNNLLTHMAGKTHRSMIAQESYDQKVSRSVTVTGVPQYLARENVQSIFSAYGKIESFHYPTKLQDSLIVRFFSVETTRKVLQGSKSLVYRGRKLYISDALIPPPDALKCPPPPTISARHVPEHSHAKDVDAKFIEHQNLYSQDWKPTYPESNFKDSRNVDTSIKSDLRDKARKSDLEERYQHFRKMLENESRTGDPVREQQMYESYLHRSDHGLKIDNRFNNLDMRNQPALDSYSQRNPKEPKMDYRFQNSDTGRNYLLSDSQNYASNREKHVTSFHKSQDPIGREVVAESSGRLPILSKYVPSFTSRNTVGRNEMTSENPFKRRDIDDRALDIRSRDLDRRPGGSEFKRDLIPEYKHQNPASRTHSSDLHYQKLRRGSPDRKRKSRSRDNEKRTQETQYQDREMKSSMMERQDLKNEMSDFRFRDRDNSQNKKSYYRKADQSSSNPDLQAQSSDSVRSAREGRMTTPTISNRSPDYSRSKRISQFDDSKDYVPVSLISSEFINSLDLKGDFKQQLSTLMSGIRQFAFNPQKLRLVYADIERVLQYDFEGCRLYPSGSAVTDLALPDSQVHCSAELTESNKNKLDSKTVNVNELSTKVFFETITLHKKLFSNVEAFIRRRNPYVVLKHKPTGYCANVAFRGGFKVAQSELLKFFLSTDERLMPIFSFIRFWSTVNGILVRNYFSKYCLSLLVIFYLQRLPKPILPPIQFLQDDASYDVFEDGWNRGFKTNLREIPKNENTTDVMALIEGFFEFYGNFVFDNFVISPFIGLAIPSNVFKNLETLSVSFERYVERVKNKSVTPLRINEVMNIQDPFQLNYNVSNFVTSAIRKNFQTKCQDAFYHFQKCRRSRTYEGLLNTILNISKKFSNEKKSFKIIISLPESQSNALSEECTMLIFVRLNKLLTDVMTDVLKCKFTCLKDVKYNDKGSLLPPQVKYSCTAFYNLWSSRNSKKEPFILSSIEEESSVSDKIINCLYRNQKPNCPILVFKLEATIKLESKYIQLNISCDDGYVETFQEFYSFLGPFLDGSVRALVMRI